jgi:hypothetical protein
VGGGLRKKQPQAREKFSKKQGQFNEDSMKKKRGLGKKV